MRRVKYTTIYTAFDNIYNMSMWNKWKFTFKRASVMGDPMRFFALYLANIKQFELFTEFSYFFSS